MEQANPPTIDAIQLAVLTKRFEGIAAKMEHTLLRTARSGIINNGADFSCAILTGDARLVNPGTAIPIHVMSGPDMMAQSMIDLHPDLCRGDAYLHNSPYHGCSHAADQSILVPVIDEAGVHRFTVLAKAHQADIGNSLPTTYMTTARDVFHEGALIFPAAPSNGTATIWRRWERRASASATFWRSVTRSAGRRSKPTSSAGSITARRAWRRRLHDCRVVA